MATSIEAAFAEFASRLEITNWQQGLVAERRAKVERVLRADLALDEKVAPLLIGSWARHTLIAPLKGSDVDLLVPLDMSQHGKWLSGEGTIRALDRFRVILDVAYPNTPKRRDRNCITLHFSEFGLDIVPAFRVRRPFGHQRNFRIPDSVERRWPSTNPLRYGEAVTQLNKDMQGRFVPLTKMVKAWNRSVDSPIRSFHLECMLYTHFRGLFGFFERVDAWLRDFSYAWMLMAFYRELPNYLRGRAYDPITLDRLDAYLDNSAATTNREIAIQRARVASGLAKAAYSKRKRDPAMAIGDWRELMGEAFPVYG